MLPAAANNKQYTMPLITSFPHSAFYTPFLKCIPHFAFHILLSTFCILPIPLVCYIFTLVFAYFGYFYRTECLQKAYETMQTVSYHAKLSKIFYVGGWRWAWSDTLNIVHLFPVIMAFVMVEEWAYLSSFSADFLVLMIEYCSFMLIQLHFVYGQDQGWDYFQFIEFSLDRFDSKPAQG